MIAGETEHLLTGNYDHFLFSGKEKKEKKKVKKQLTPEELEARKNKRQQFWSGLGSQFREGSTVNNVLGLFGAGSSQASPGAYDYEVAMGGQAAPDAGKGIPVGLVALGGVLLLGLAAWGYSQYQRNQQVKLPQAP